MYDRMPWPRNLRYSLLAFTVFWLGPTAVASLWSAPYWQTCDDWHIDRTLRGFQLPGGPDAFAVYSGLVWTLPLSLLYSLTQDIPWYFIAHMAGRMLASWVVLRLALRSSGTWERLVLVGLYCGSLDTGFFVLGQFTETAVLLSGAGILAWIRGYRLLGVSKATWFTIVVAAMCLGAAIRYKSCLLTCAALLPPGAVIMAWPGAVRWFRLLRKHPAAGGTSCAALLTSCAGLPGTRWVLCRSLPMAVALSAVVGLQFLNDRIYSANAGFKEFVAYVTPQQELYDYGQCPYRVDTKEAFDSVGWSQVDYYLAMIAFQTEEDKFSREAFLKISEWFDQKYGRIIKPVDWGAVFSNTMSGANAVFYCYPIATLMLLRHRRRHLVAFVVVISTTLLVLLYCGLYLNKLPLRVLRPSATLIILFFLTTPARSRPGASLADAALKALGVCISLVAAGAFLHDLSRSQQSYANAEKEYRRMMEIIAPFGRDPGLIFAVGNAMPYESIPAYDNPHEYSDVRVVWLPTSRFPNWEQQRVAWGVPDVFNAILHRPNTYVLTPNLAAPILGIALLERYAVIAPLESMTDTFVFHRDRVRLVRFVPPEQALRE